MKKLILVILVVLLPLSYLFAGDIVKMADDSNGITSGGQNNGGMLTGGGPDAFGYRWKDSNDAGGPVFNWVDISGIGTEVTWIGSVDDGYTDPIDMGITFTYYGTDYTSLVVSTNGWASFLPQTNSYLSNAAIPTVGDPNALLAVDWDDLDGGTVGHCYYYSDVAQNRFIVSWVGWPYYPDPTGPHDFQIIINANDSSVVYQYGTGDYASQTDITVGTENETGTIGLQLAYNTAYPTNNLATRFWRPPSLAHDVSVNAILAPGPFTYKDSTYSVSSRVRNVGNNTESNVGVGFVIKDTTGATVYTHTYTILSLPPDAESTITFPNWVPAEGKTHVMKSFTSLAGDLDRTNDTARATTYTYTYHGSGGPVGYWTYADQNSGGQPFNWIELAGTGNPVTFSSQDDGLSGMIDMGMPFYYFGTSYSNINICTNGWLSFTETVSHDYNNVAIPNPTVPNALVALLWDDLYVPTTGAVYTYHDAGTNQFIVEYDSVEFYTSGGPDCIKMEAIFNGNTNSIKMQYGYFCDSSQSDITIGIENETGTVGLAYDNNGEVLQTPTAGLALTWIYTAPSHDVRPEAFVAPLPSGMIGQPVSPQVTFRNAGASDEVNVPVRMLITPGTYNNTQTIPTLDSGMTANATFSSFTPAVGGVYTLTAISNLATDIDRTNDTLRTTYSVYDTILNFEANNGNLAASGDWQWGVPTSGPMAAFSGQNCWGTILDGNYNNNTVSILQFDLNVGINNPSISFAQWLLTETGYDGGNFRISTDGVNWQVISPIGGYDRIGYTGNPFYPDSIFSGIDTTWNTVTFPLSDFAGQTVLAQIEFGTNPTTTNAGWFIDDLGLMGCSITSPNMGHSPDAITGNAPPGGSTSAPLTISNSGTGPLYFTAKARQDIQPQPSSMPHPAPLGYRQVVDKNGDTYQEPYYPPVIQAQGGPDAFGNYWIDSDEPNGPVYNWVDITTNGTEITGLSDDSNVGPFDIGFDFTFYGVPFNTFRFCTNGFISFTSTVTAYNNASIPSGAEPFNLVAPFWDDHTFVSSGNAYYYSTPESLVVAWINVPHFSSGGPYTYEIILLANGNIIYQYQSMGTPVDNSTIGIQNADGTDGLQVVYNALYLHDSMAIKIVAPFQWLSVHPNSGLIAPAGNPIDLTVGMDATGLTSGTYTGNVYLYSNDPNHTQVTVPVTFTVTGGGGNCVYMPGDINGNHSVNGVDIVFAVNYFKGAGNHPPVDCFPQCPGTPNPFYAAGDVNGNCAFNGIDITYFVRYLKLQVPSLLSCPSCPPAADLAPAVMPSLTPHLNSHIQNGQ